MEAILRSVSSSQRTPGVPHRPSHGMARSGVTIRSRATSWSARGIRSGSTIWISWDGGGHHRGGSDQPGFPCQGVLQVAEPASLAQTGAGRVRGNASGDDQVDRLHVLDPGSCGRTGLLP